MNPFIDFPMLSTFIAIVAVVLMVRIMKTILADGKAVHRVCSECGETMPATASYCRRCGRKLDY